MAPVQLRSSLGFLAFVVLDSQRLTRCISTAVSVWLENDGFV